jgi:hypothetical protein
MSIQYSIDEAGVQASPLVAQDLSQQLTTFVQPLLVCLDAVLDLRLIQTFLATLHILLVFRHRNNGLVLSELGAYLTSPDHAPAGTKRRSRPAACSQMVLTAHRTLSVAASREPLGCPGARRRRRAAGVG